MSSQNKGSERLSRGEEKTKQRDGVSGRHYGRVIFPGLPTYIDDLSPSISIIYQEYEQTCLHDNLMKILSQLRVPLPR